MTLDSKKKENESESEVGSVPAEVEDPCESGANLWEWNVPGGVER